MSAWFKIVTVGAFLNLILLHVHFRYITWTIEKGLAYDDHGSEKNAKLYGIELCWFTGPIFAINTT